MTSKFLSSHSTPDLRQELRWRRRLKLGQSLWRFLLLTSFTGGLFWAIRQPIWVIENQSQIIVKGNDLLTEEIVRSLVPLHYPQSFWQIPTAQALQELKTKAPLQDAELTRSLLPPQLIVTIRERQPVALAFSGNVAQTTTAESLILIGFLDKKGILMPEAYYRQTDWQDSQPTLKVIGFQPQHQEAWQILYQFLATTSVQIEAVDWRDPHTLILQTNLGTIRCGNYLWQLSQQLAVLNQLKSLPEQIDSTTINYIDLTNPEKPAIKLMPENQGTFP